MSQSRLWPHLPYGSWNIIFFLNVLFVYFCVSVKSSNEELITDPAEPVGCRLPCCSAVRLLMNEFLVLGQVSKAPVMVPI